MEVVLGVGRVEVRVSLVRVDGKDGFCRMLVLGLFEGICWNLLFGCMWLRDDYLKSSLLVVMLSFEDELVFIKFDFG